jgi:Icc-related predicted phosphoesterase
MFYTTDLHGSEQCFLKFVNAGKFYKVNVLVCGGDITGKMIVPLVQTGNDAYEAEFLGKTQMAKGEEAAKQLEKSISYAGYYPFRSTKEEMTRLNANPAEVDKLFSDLMRQRVERWIRVAEDKLKGTGINCIITPGNDDRLDIDSAFDASEFVINPEGKVVSIDANHEMISTGYTNITPWNCPRDISEEELGKKIEGMASKVTNMSTCIFNLHCPPYDSNIDSAPKLDKDLKPIVSPGGEMVMIPVGSTSVRTSLEKYQPLLGLHGHIHESRGTAKIGRTLCLNPGSEYGEGILRGALITFENDKVKSYQLTSG